MRLGRRWWKVANEVRRLFLGQADAGQELTVTAVHRTLVRWARLALTFKGAPQPLAYTLDQALTARAEPEQREAIHRIAADVFGSLWTGPHRERLRAVPLHPCRRQCQGLAWCEQPGVGMEVRWGRAGRLAQKAVSPPSSRRRGH